MYSVRSGRFVASPQQSRSSCGSVVLAASLPNYATPVLPSPPGALLSAAHRISNAVCAWAVLASACLQLNRASVRSDCSLCPSHRWILPWTTSSDQLYACASPAAQAVESPMLTPCAIAAVAECADDAVHPAELLHTRDTQ